jgi:DNA-binding MarR family transcriptional regulator
VHPALLMFISSRDAERRIHAAVAEAGCDDFTPAMGRVAARVADEGSRITELAEQTLITKQSASALVDQLERAGYVARTPDPRDARARLVVLAARGEVARAAARREEERIEREWREHLGPERMAAMQDALEVLREITDPWR